MPLLRRWLLANSLLASLLVHGALFGGAVGYIHWRDAHADRFMDIDLRGQSLLARPVNPQGGARAAQPPQPWIMATGNRTAPPPKQELTSTAQVQEDAGPACPPPCPETAGDWVSAAATSRKPQWNEGMITEEDYPGDMRRQGKEGKVVAQVLIDAEGNVRGVTLLQSSHPEFNELVLERLKRSKFKPAYDNNGEAVPCRLALPIAFELF